MKIGIVLSSVAFLIVVVSGGRHAKYKVKDSDNLRCESSEGCCEDPLDCPGCCNPPYKNQCTNVKGVPFNFCEITGTFFYPIVNYPLSYISPYNCLTLTIAGNYPSNCQASGWLISKTENITTLANGTKVKTLIHSYPRKVDYYRVSSCGQYVIRLNDFFPETILGSNFEPFAINVAVVKRNQAGFAIILCYAIDNSPVILAYALTPSPKPADYLLDELREALEPYAGSYDGLYDWSYDGCYPSLNFSEYSK